MKNSDVKIDNDLNYSFIEVDENPQNLKIEFEIFYHSDQWLKIENLETGILSLAKATFNKVSYKEEGPILISLVFSNDFELQQLNKSFRKKDKPTNVLSFPAGNDEWQSTDEPELLGDIILAYETITSEAEALNMSLKDHIYHLVVHGILHLLGFDHENDSEAKVMEGLEKDILASLGIIINQPNNND